MMINRLGRGVGVRRRPRRTTVRVCAAAILIPIVAAAGANASIGDFQAEGVPVPAWFTDVTTKLGCTLPDDPNDSPYTIFVSCGVDWSGAGCRALMSVFRAEPLPRRASPGGYEYAEFRCTAAPLGASEASRSVCEQGGDVYQRHLMATPERHRLGRYGGQRHQLRLRGCPDHLRRKKVRTDKRGGAKLTIHVPGTGRLDLTGNGIQHAKATPQKAETVTMPVEATGSKRQKLHDTGSVKVKAKIKFQPYFGDGQPSSQSRTIKLHESLK